MHRGGDAGEQCRAERTCADVGSLDRVGPEVGMLQVSSGVPGEQPFIQQIVMKVSTQELFGLIAMRSQIAGRDAKVRIRTGGKASKGRGGKSRRAYSMTSERMICFRTESSGEAGTVCAWDGQTASAKKSPGKRERNLVESRMAHARGHMCQSYDRGLSVA